MDQGGSGRVTGGSQRDLGIQVDTGVHGHMNRRVWEGHRRLSEGSWDMGGYRSVCMLDI